MSPYSVTTTHGVFPVISLRVGKTRATGKDRNRARYVRAYYMTAVTACTLGKIPSCQRTSGHLQKYSEVHFRRGRTTSLSRFLVLPVSAALPAGSSSRHKVKSDSSHGPSIQSFA